METLTVKLDDVQEQFASLQASSQTREVQFELDLKQFQSIVNNLRKENERLASLPRLDDTVHELENRIKEMDALMSAKNQEIEDNDDRVIGYVAPFKYGAPHECFLGFLKRRKNLPRKLISLCERFRPYRRS